MRLLTGSYEARVGGGLKIQYEGRLFPWDGVGPWKGIGLEMDF